MSSEWNAALAWILLETSLRIAVLAAIVSLILFAVRVRSSRALHAAWTTVLVVMLLMPVLPYVMPSISIRIPIESLPLPTDFDASEAAMAAADVPGESGAALSALVPPAESASRTGHEQKAIWLKTGIAFYCIGVLFFLARVFRGLRAMARIARRSKPVILDTVSQPGLRIGRTPIFDSEIVAAPLTIGIIAPRIILPSGWKKWSAEKLSIVLAHEFSHIRRRDTLVSLLSQLNRCFFWFHPLAWWLERKLAATAELASDDDAMLVIGKTKLYAVVLLEMAQAVRQRGGRLAWQGMGISGNGLLSQRIERILHGDLRCEISLVRRGFIICGCALSIFIVGACHQKQTSSASRQEGAKLEQDDSKSLWAKRFRIFTNPVNAPFEFGSGTSVQGIDVAIGNEIGRTLGAKVKWVKAPIPGYTQNHLKLAVDLLFGRSLSAPYANDYEYLFELMKMGRADILISSVAIDPARSADFDFSKPYYETGDVIAYQRGRSDITNLAGLSGRKVGVAAGRPGDSFMARQKAVAGIKLVHYSSIDDAMADLNVGELDAVVGDVPLIAYSIQTSFHNTTFLPVLINRYQYAAVVRKGQKDLLAKINVTIDQLISSGELRKLDDAWFGIWRREAVNERQPEEARRIRQGRYL
jgi:ABC-type amino acid transport substrate-binding protein/beta-lactamase regulating signal transducer with metallopeptidase domain